ncbi:MAG TPA: GntR family transcriptional regulator [Longimicrobiales bacterium]|nr:GntR family transcriptional regulator [Longimicrobiales bacterium]
MFDDIDPRSPTPLYEQIASRIRVAVAAREVLAGQPLPSVRQLAATLRVNPATVGQAYRDLESDGFVVMRHGAGTFVADVSSELQERERGARARALVRTLLEEAARSGIEGREIEAILREELGGPASTAGGRRDGGGAS